MFDGSKWWPARRCSAADVNIRVIDAIKNRAMIAVPNVSVKFVTPLMKLLLPIKAMDLNEKLGMATCNDTWRAGRVDTK